MNQQIRSLLRADIRILLPFWSTDDHLIVVGKGQQETPKSPRTQVIVYVGLYLQVYSHTKII